MRPYTTKERLKEILKKRSIKQIDIVNLCKPYCEKYGERIEKPDISQYISGKATPSQRKLTILGLALNVNEPWLMGYDVPMEREYEKSKIGTVNIINLSTNEVMQKIPILYRTDVAEDSPDNFFAIIASDNSMAPLLDVGDIAIIRKYKEFINGKTYLLKIKDGTPIIRKVIKNDADMVELHALNMWNYPVQTDLMFSDIELLGNVVRIENKSAFL